MHPMRAAPEPQPHEPYISPPPDREETTETNETPPPIANEWSPFHWKRRDPLPKPKNDYLCRPS
jgi:hypothetical protein